MKCGLVGLRLFFLRESRGLCSGMESLFVRRGCRGEGEVDAMTLKEGLWVVVMKVGGGGTAGSF